MGPCSVLNIVGLKMELFILFSILECIGRHATTMASAHDLMIRNLFSIKDYDCIVTGRGTKMIFC
jgi:hypothetical protein